MLSLSKATTTLMLALPFMLGACYKTPMESTALSVVDSSEHQLDVRIMRSWIENGANNFQVEVAVRPGLVPGWQMEFSYPYKIINLWEGTLSAGSATDAYVVRDPRPPKDPKNPGPAPDETHFGFIATGKDAGKSRFTKVRYIEASAKNSPNDSPVSTTVFEPIATQAVIIAATPVASSVAVAIQQAPGPAPTQQSLANDDWLQTSGKKIIDQGGNPVWLTGVNWFGYNTGTNTFDGLWNAKLEPMLQAIAVRGFNIVRIPMSVEIIQQWRQGKFPKAQYNSWENKDLNSKNSLEIFDHAIRLADKYGLKIMLDMHSTESEPMGHLKPLWYSTTYSTEDFYQAWEWLATRYKANDTILAFDLKNEPHGKLYSEAGALWNDSKDPNNWKHVAETAAKRILAIHPKVLILVEGTESYPKDDVSFTATSKDKFHDAFWGANLRGVRKYPIKLGAYQSQLVYAPHDYGPNVYMQPWFANGYSVEALYKNYWRDTWAFISDENIAPLFIGEWGGKLDKGDNEAWMTSLRTYMVQERIHHAFWSLNPNSGDTEGLLKPDFLSWDEEKYLFVKASLWQSRGKFVGLDHQRALGSEQSGMSLKTYQASGAKLFP